MFVYFLLEIQKHKIIKNPITKFIFSKNAFLIYVNSVIQK